MKYRIALLSGVIAVSLLAFGASTAIAARGGKGGGGTTTSTATCSVTPNPAAAGTQFTITGKKYAANQFLTLAIVSTNGTSFVWIQADAAGNFSKPWTIYTTGKNTIKVHNSIGNALLATCTVTTV